MPARKTTPSTPAAPVSRFHCVKCQHEWVPRSFVSGGYSYPLLCPKCHCRKWDGGTPQKLTISPAEVRAARNEMISKAIRERYAHIPKHICLRCGHEWPIRTSVEPCVCPKCNSTLWNKPRKLPVRAQAANPRRLACLRCGHEWTTRYDGLPKNCPACNSPRWNIPRKNRRRAAGEGAAAAGHKASQGTTPGSRVRVPRKDKTSQGQRSAP